MLYKCFRYLCPCLKSPCIHFTAADNAMMSYPKYAHTRDIIRREFNFATFVRNLLAVPGGSRKAFCIKIAVRYGVDVNQVDPVYGRNALHYVYMFNDFKVMRYIEDMGEIRPTLDIYGLPPTAYEVGIQTMPAIPEFLPGMIRVKSKKLFRFLFMNETPERWSTSVLESVNKKELILMEPSKRHQLLTQARDDKGNTILHLAAKANKLDLVDYILEFYPDLATIKNKKNKTPSEYCKFIDTFSLFNEPWKQGVYFRRSYIVSNPFVELTHLLPQLVRVVVEKEKNVIVNNLDLFREYQYLLSAETVINICRSVVDFAGNNLWHIYAIESCHAMMDKIGWSRLFARLDVRMINDQNVYGQTPLHLADRQEIKEYLLESGAHPDALDKNDRIASHRVLNLQCIAARHIPDRCNNVPLHLVPIVRLHKPGYCD